MSPAKEETPETGKKTQNPLKTELGMKWETHADVAKGSEARC